MLFSTEVIVTTELLGRNVFIVLALGSRTINTLRHIEASVVTILSQ